MIDTQPDMKVVAEAANGREAVELHRAHQPDIVLMDLRMPVLGAVEATVAIREQFPLAHIIVLTTYDGDENIYRALQAGARAYLLKDIPCATNSLTPSKPSMPGSIAFRRRWRRVWPSACLARIWLRENWKSSI